MPLASGWRCEDGSTAARTKIAVAAKKEKPLAMVENYTGWSLENTISSKGENLRFIQLQ